MPYIVLDNKEATIFADTGSGVKVTSHTVPVKVKKLTKRMIEGIKGKAIKQLTDEEAEEAMEKAEKKKSEATSKAQAPAPTGNEPPLEERLSKMTSEELNTYYQEEYDAEEDDMKAFKAMSKKDKIKYLLD